MVGAMARGSGQDGGYRHVACCVEDVAASERALDEAGRIAGLSGARLSLVHVVETPAAFTGGRSPWSPPEERVAAELVERARAELEPAAASAGPADAVVLQSDDAAGEVVAWARREGCDLLVACPRRHGIARAILGSFASHLVRDAPCSVLLVPASPGR
jgi:nucleotide-binding universal stress UspA family protein